jgi:hypothetical protein
MVSFKSFVHSPIPSFSRMVAFSWKDMKNMKNRNEELKDIIKDQKKIEEEMEKYMIF